MVQDLTNQKFGYLTVLGFDHKDKASHTYWLCVCKCGTTHIAENYRLISGKTTSCGCRRSENIRELNQKRRGSPRDIGWAYYENTYKHGKSGKRLGYHLNSKQFQNICTQQCFYCGTLPSLEVTGAYESAKRTTRIKFDEDFYEQTKIVVNGIDRIDSSIGYITSNVVTCCSVCNFAKSNRQQDEFLKWIESVYEHKERMCATTLEAKAEGHVARTPG